MALYQIISTLAFLAALGWVLKSRNPFYLGALLGGFFLFGFDWIWCAKSFFNATFAPGLVLIPGIHIMEQTYPIAVAFNWAVGFGLLPLLLSKLHPTLSRKLGVLHFPVVLAVAAVLDMLAEVPLVSGLGVYTYHQAPEYLIWGVPWSNLWFGGGLLALPYFGLAYMEKWAAIPPGAGFSPSSETTWKGMFMAAATLWGSFFFLTVLQLFWYSAVAPWVESGRLF